MWEMRSEGKRDRKWSNVFKVEKREKYSAMAVESTAT